MKPVRRIGICTLFCCLLIPTAAISQESDGSTTPPPPPCSSPEFRQLDFWVGEWDLTWADSGRGENIITRQLDDCVIEENFKSFDKRPFRGNSVSTYDVKAGKWRQTWVDNQGGYYAFEGGMVGDSMILGCEAKASDGSPSLLRMVFHNIEKNSLDWSWERSVDDGKSWLVLWAIHYERRK